MVKSDDDNKPHNGQPSSKKEHPMILDDLTRIVEQEASDPQEIERELAEAEPVPLSPSFIERTVSELRLLQSRAAPRRVPVPWWRTRAAMIPFAALVLMAAATPIYLIWSGRNSSKELAYEDALTIVFDDNYTVDSRKAAQRRVYSSVLKGITTLKANTHDPVVGQRAKLAIVNLTKMAANPEVATVGPALFAGRYETVLSSMADERLSMAKRIESIDELVTAMKMGIRVLRVIEKLGPPFGRDARLAINYLKQRLALPGKERLP